MRVYFEPKETTRLRDRDAKLSAWYMALVTLALVLSVVVQP